MKDRSSLEAFLLFVIQAKQKSSLLRFSGIFDRLELFEVDGRVSGVGDDGFRVIGRGCDITFNISGARFECFVERDLPVVVLRPDDPESALRPLWKLEWESEDVLYVGELRVPK